MANVGNLAEVFAFGIIVVLQSPNLIRCRNELFGQFNHFLVRPDGPPAHYAIASCTTERMPIHDPQQQGLVGLIGGHNPVAKCGKPIDVAPHEVIFLRKDEFDPRCLVLFGRLDDNRVGCFFFLLLAWQMSWNQGKVCRDKKWNRTEGGMNGHGKSAFFAFTKVEG